MHLSIPLSLRNALLGALCISSLTVATGTLADTTGNNLGNVMYVGDSITEGISSSSYRWPFFKILVDNGISQVEKGVRTGGAAGYPGWVAPGTNYGGRTFASVHSAQSSARTFHVSGRTYNSGFFGGSYIKNWLGQDPLLSNGTTAYAGATFTGANKPDTYFILLGTNDLLSEAGFPGSLATRQSTLLGYNGSTFSGTGDMDTIVDSMRTSNAAANITVMSIPCWTAHANSDTEAFHAGVAAYNVTLQQWATQKGVIYVDVNKGMIDVASATSFYGVGSMFKAPGSDGLHPNAHGDLIIAGNLAKASGYAGATAGQVRRATTAFTQKTGTNLTMNSLTLGVKTTAAVNETFSWLGTDVINKGFTIDFLAKVGNGGTALTPATWNIDSNFAVSVGNGTITGVLNINEAYIKWGSTILYSMDMSTNLDSLRVAYTAGNAAEGVASGFYVWLGDMMIGQGLTASTGTLSGATLTYTGAEGIILSDFSMTGGAYAPTTTGFTNSAAAFIMSVAPDPPPPAIPPGRLLTTAEWAASAPISKTAVWTANHSPSTAGGTALNPVSQSYIITDITGTHGTAFDISAAPFTGTNWGDVYVDLQGGRVSRFYAGAGTFTGGTTTQNGSIYFRVSGTTNATGNVATWGALFGALANAGTTTVNGNVYLEMSAPDLLLNTFTGSGPSLAGTYVGGAAGRAVVNGAITIAMTTGEAMGIIIGMSHNSTVTGGVYMLIGGSATQVQVSTALAEANTNTVGYCAVLGGIFNVATTANSVASTLSGGTHVTVSGNTLLKGSIYGGIGYRTGTISTVVNTINGGTNVTIDGNGVILKNGATWANIYGGSMSGASVTSIINGGTNVTLQNIGSTGVANGMQDYAGLISGGNNGTTGTNLTITGTKTMNFSNYNTEFKGSLASFDVINIKDGSHATLGVAGAVATANLNIDATSSLYLKTSTPSSVSNITFVDGAILTLSGNANLTIGSFSNIAGGNLKIDLTGLVSGTTYTLLTSAGVSTTDFASFEFVNVGRKNVDMITTSGTITFSLDVSELYWNSTASSWTASNAWGLDSAEGTPTTFQTGDIVHLTDAGSAQIINIDSTVEADVISMDSGNYTLTGSRKISLASSLVVNDGVLTVSMANDYAGGTNIKGGTLIAAATDALGTSVVTFAGGVLQISNDISLANTFAQTGGNTARISVDAGKVLTFGVARTGTATHTLEGAGTVRATVAGAFGTSNINVNSGTLEFSLAAGATYTNNITTTGGKLVISGAGIFTHNTGLVTLGAGGVQVSAAGAGAGSLIRNVTITSNQTWDVAAGKFFRIGTNVGNQGNVTNVGSNTITIKGGGTVAIELTGNPLAFLDLGTALHWVVTGGSTLAIMCTNWGNSITLDNGKMQTGVVASVGGVNSQASWTYPDTFDIHIAAGGGTLGIGHSAATGNRDIVINGKITGAGDLTINKFATAGTAVALSIVTLAGDNSGYTGKLTLDGSLASTNLSLVVNGKIFQGNLVFNGNTATNTWLTIGGAIVDDSYAGSISGNGSITLNRTGETFTMSGASTYTGTTTITAGTLRLSGAGTLGTGNITNAGILEIAKVADITMGQTISGAGAVKQTGTGTTTLTGTNTYTGATSVSAGKLVAGSNQAFGTGAVTMSGGTLDLGNRSVANAISTTAGAGTRTITNAGAYTSTLTVNANTTLTGALGAGIASLVVSGATTTLTWAGSTAVCDGAASMFTLANLTHNGIITFDLQGTTWDVGTYTLLTYTNSTGSGTYDWTSGADVNITGVLDYSTANTVKLVVSSVIPTSADINIHSTVTAANGDVTKTNISSTGSLDVGDLAAVTLTGTSIAGVANVTGGSLTITAPSAITQVTSNITATGNADGGSGIVDIKGEGANLGMGGAITGGTITVTNGIMKGTLTDTYNNTTTQSESTLENFTGTAAIAVAGGTGTLDNVTVGAGGLTVAAEATATITGTATIAGAVTGSGTVSVEGLLHSTGSIAGVGILVQDGGTLQGSGSMGNSITVKGGGTHIVGSSPGVVRTGAYTVEEDGKAYFSFIAKLSDIGDNVAGRDYSEMTASDTFSLEAGAIFRLELHNKDFLNGPPTLSDIFTYNIVLFNALSITDGETTITGIDDADAWLQSNLSMFQLDRGMIFVSAHFVNDLTGTYANGLQLQLQYVPEPTTATLGILGLAGLLLRRRRATR